MAIHTWFECKIRYECNGKRNAEEITEPYSC